MRMNDIPIGIL